ncbi:hypothetical protein N2152v2_008126 [Parachlorella kessleri]
MRELKEEAEEVVKQDDKNHNKENKEHKKVDTAAAAVQPTAVAASPAGGPSSDGESVAATERTANGAAMTHRNSQELSMKHLVRHPRIQPFEAVGQFGLDNVYQPIRLLGRGGSGQTWLCRDKETRRLYALKMQQRPLPSNTVELTYNEITIQAQTGEGHINMCHIREVVLTPSHLALVLDYEAGGSVAEFVASRIPLVSKLDLCISEGLARFMFKQLVSGVDFLHKNHIAHRDIKLDNTLLDGCDPPRVKLCDFQFARYWGPTAYGRMSTHLGTAVYMSPELITNRKDHHDYDPVEADVWACGIWLVALLVGAFPFDNRPGVDDVTAEMQILHQEMSGSWRESRFVKPYVGQLSPECVDLLDKILHVDPLKRIKIPEIQAHPWMQQPFPRKLQQAWDRLKVDQAAVTKKLKGMKFDYVSCSAESCIHMRNNRVLQLVNEAAARDPMRDSYSVLRKAGEVAMVDFQSIPGAVRIDMRPEAVAQRINPRALAMLDTAPDAAPPAQPAAAAAAAPPAAAGAPAPGTPHALAPAPAAVVETQPAPAPLAVAQSAG